MEKPPRNSLLVLGLLLSAITGVGQSVPDAQVVQAWLTEPGSTPFYLQAVITERSDPNEHIDVEMSWLTPDKWKRTIKSEEFSQTLIVNGEKVFEEDSADMVIEQIAGDGTPGLAIPCMQAIGKWQFSPFIEDGNPRPYRGEITFRAP
jgi:hypothetical protein